jgi:hypothetical protein
MELRYAHDNAISAHLEEHILGILDAFAKMYTVLGLALNIKKTPSPT